MNRFAISLACAATALFAASSTRCQDADAQKPSKNIVQIAQDAGQFQTLVAAVQAAGLAKTLSGKGPFTVFAPTDAAFQKLGKKAIADLLLPQNKDKLTAILTYHVASGNLMAAKVVGQKTIATLQGDALPVKASDAGVTIGTAKVVTTDIVGSNGVIHVIDTVLVPDLRPNLVEAANQAGQFATLLAAAKAAGLADTLANGGPFTVFAPTDEAFARLGKETITDLLWPENKKKLAAILSHHVVAGVVPSQKAIKLTEAATLSGQPLKLEFDGKVLQVGGAKVITADVEAKNGVIHVIDTVLLPQG